MFHDQCIQSQGVGSIPLGRLRGFRRMVAECNQGEDAFSGYGEWFYIPDNPLPNNDRVIYFGTWGNDHSPGASSYTNAEIFDMDDPIDAAEYVRSGSRGWGKPEPSVKKSKTKLTPTELQ